MRTISGIKFFNNDIAALEQIKTNIVANPILIPFIAELVVASVGHIPKSNTRMGFSRIIPLKSTFKFLFLVFILSVNCHYHCHRYH